MADAEDLESTTPPDLYPCSICSRTFKAESLDKHYKSCEKNASKKRKIFDSTKQRIQGTDLAEYLPSLLKTKKAETASPRKKPQSNWKAQHLEFVKAIRAARGVMEGFEGESTSMDAITRPPNTEPCPTCDRNFGPKAYERHIEWCREQKARLPSKSPASNETNIAKERLAARTKYRAPLTKTKRSIVREKYAGIGEKPPLNGEKGSGNGEISRKSSVNISSSAGDKQTSMANIKSLHGRSQANSASVAKETTSAVEFQRTSNRSSIRLSSPTKRNLSQSLSSAKSTERSSAAARARALSPQKGKREAKDVPPRTKKELFHVLSPKAARGDSVGGGANLKPTDRNNKVGRTQSKRLADGKSRPRIPSEADGEDENERVGALSVERNGTSEARLDRERRHFVEQRIFRARYSLVRSLEHVSLPTIPEVPVKSYCRPAKVVLLRKRRSHALKYLPPRGLAMRTPPSRQVMAPNKVNVGVDTFQEVAIRPFNENMRPCKIPLRRHRRKGAVLAESRARESETKKALTGVDIGVVTVNKDTGPAHETSYDVVLNEEMTCKAKDTSPDISQSVKDQSMFANDGVKVPGKIQPVWYRKEVDHSDDSTSDEEKDLEARSGGLSRGPIDALKERFGAGVTETSSSRLWCSNRSESYLEARKTVENSRHTDRASSDDDGNQTTSACDALIVDKAISDGDAVRDRSSEPFTPRFAEQCAEQSQDLRLQYDAEDINIKDCPDGDVDNCVDPLEPSGYIQEIMDNTSGLDSVISGNLNVEAKGARGDSETLGCSSLLSMCRRNTFTVEKKVRFRCDISPEEGTANDHSGGKKEIEAAIHGGNDVNPSANGKYTRETRKALPRHLVGVLNGSVNHVENEFGSDLGEGGSTCAEAHREKASKSVWSRHNKEFEFEDGSNVNVRSFGVKDLSPRLEVRTCMESEQKDGNSGDGNDCKREESDSRDKDDNKGEESDSRDKDDSEGEESDNREQRSETFVRGVYRPKSIYQRIPSVEGIPQCSYGDVQVDTRPTDSVADLDVPNGGTQSSKGCGFEGDIGEENVENNDVKGGDESEVIRNCGDVISGECGNNEVIDDVNVAMEDGLEGIDQVNVAMEGGLEVIDDVNVAMESGLEGIDDVNVSMEDGFKVIDDVNVSMEGGLEVIDEVNVAMDGGFKVIDDVNVDMEDGFKVIDDVNVSMEDGFKVIDDVNVSMEGGFKVIDDVNVTVEDGFKVIDDVNVAMENGLEVIDEVNVSMEDGFKVIDDVNVSMEDGFKVIDDVNVSMEGGFKVIDDVNVSMEDGFKVIDEVNVSMEDGFKVIDDVNVAMEGGLEVIDDVNVSMEDGFKAIDDVNVDMEDGFEVINEVEGGDQAETIQDGLYVDRAEFTRPGTYKVHPSKSSRLLLARRASERRLKHMKSEGDLLCDPSKCCHAHLASQARSVPPGAWRTHANRPTHFRKRSLHHHNRRDPVYRALAEEDSNSGFETDESLELLSFRELEENEAGSLDEEDASDKDGIRPSVSDKRLDNYDSVSMKTGSSVSSRAASRISVTSDDSDGSTDSDVGSPKKFIRYWGHDLSVSFEENRAGELFRDRGLNGKQEDPSSTVGYLPDFGLSPEAIDEHDKQDLWQSGSQPESERERLVCKEVASPCGASHISVASNPKVVSTRRKTIRVSQSSPALSPGSDRYAREPVAGTEEVTYVKQGHGSTKHTCSDPTVGNSNRAANGSEASRTDRRVLEHRVKPLDKAVALRRRGRLTRSKVLEDRSSTRDESSRIYRFGGDSNGRVTLSQHGDRCLEVSPPCSKLNSPERSNDSGVRPCVSQSNYSPKNRGSPERRIVSTAVGSSVKVTAIERPISDAVDREESFESWSNKEDWEVTSLHDVASPHSSGCPSPEVAESLEYSPNKGTRVAESLERSPDEETQSLAYSDRRANNKYLFDYSLSRESTPDFTSADYLERKRSILEVADIVLEHSLELELDIPTSQETSFCSENDKTTDRENASTRSMDSVRSSPKRPAGIKLGCQVVSKKEYMETLRAKRNRKATKQRVDVEETADSVCEVIVPLREGGVPRKGTARAVPRVTTHCTLERRKTNQAKPNVLVQSHVERNSSRKPVEDSFWEQQAKVPEKAGKKVVRTAIQPPRKPQKVPEESFWAERAKPGSKTALTAVLTAPVSPIRRDQARKSVKLPPLREQSNKRGPRTRLPGLNGSYFSPSLPNFTLLLNSSSAPLPAESYDPFASAKRQLMELLAQGEASPKSRSPSPTPPTVLETSPASAFSRYTASPPPPLKQRGSEFVPVERAISMNDNDDDDDDDFGDLVISGRSLTKTPSVSESNENLAHIVDIAASLSSLSVCSLEDFNLRNNNNNNTRATRRNVRYRDKLENAALSLRQSVSMFRPDDLDPFDLDDLPESFSLSSLGVKPAPSPSRHDLGDDANGHRSKFNADSAYSSLNRKSPLLATRGEPNQSEVVDSTTVHFERLHLSSSGSDSSLPHVHVSQAGTRKELTSPSFKRVHPGSFQSTTNQKLSKFCHECGSKFPLNEAKFCCECGVRRLLV